MTKDKLSPAQEKILKFLKSLPENKDVDLRIFNGRQGPMLIISPKKRNG